jgi:hypothetical protein
VRLHETMVDHVCLQVTLGDEGKGAPRIGAFEWSFIRLQDTN